MRKRHRDQNGWVSTASIAVLMSVVLLALNSYSQGVRQLGGQYQQESTFDISSSTSTGTIVSTDSTSDITTRNDDNLIIDNEFIMTEHTKASLNNVDDIIIQQSLSTDDDQINVNLDAVLNYEVRQSKNSQIQRDSTIRYSASYNDTEDPMNPFLSIAPDPIPLVATESMYSQYYNRMIRNRHECIQHIRAKHDVLLGPLIIPTLLRQQQQLLQQQAEQLLLSSAVDNVESNVLLVDPAYHWNVGDHMLSLGEIEFIKRLEEKNGINPIPIEQCNYDQAREFVQRCDTLLQKQQLELNQTAVPITEEFGASISTKRRAALWHAGGNWGNLYRNTHAKRIKSFQQLLRAGYDPIISMPQSLYYSISLVDAAYTDAEAIAHSIASALDFGNVIDNNSTSARKVLRKYKSLIREKIIFTWREKDGYRKGSRLYPFATNLLVPDIAFQLGPYNGTQYKIDSSQLGIGLTETTMTAVDIVFFLRNDSESIYPTIRDNIELIQSMIDMATKQQRRRTSKQGTRSTIQQHLQNKYTFRVYDWQSRQTLYANNNHFLTDTAIELLASGKVVIVDRLHAGILSYLSGLPLILLDNVSQKINQTLEVAFDTWSGCYNTEHGMYTTATDISNAIQLAIEFIDKYHL